MPPTAQNESNVEERDRAEMQVRYRRLRRLVIAGVSVAAYLLIGMIRVDKVLVRSKHTNQTIVIRLVSKVPFWAWPLDFFFNHNRPYRCEYYRVSWLWGSHLWSCVSGYPWDSGEARSAEIEWDAAGAVATVRIEGSHQFICRSGEWSEVRPQ
jgi:hypothetical protein